MTSAWRRYYETTGAEPRETLVDALERFDAEGAPPGVAVDLGCGTGRDTIELLRRGWQVVAVDGEPEAIDRLRARVEPLDQGDRLTTVVSTFDEAEWPQARLVNASFSLPFTPRATFPRLWERIRSSLEPGGRFCGQLFGERDDWARRVGTACHKGEVVGHSRPELDELLRQFAVERLDEVEEDGETAVGDWKHWHVYHLVVRKR